MYFRGYVQFFCVLTNIFMQIDLPKSYILQLKLMNHKYKFFFKLTECEIVKLYFLKTIK